MRKWFLPIAVFSLGSLGMVLGTERGREVVMGAIEQLDRSPEDFHDVNEIALQELQRIQQALNGLAVELSA